MKNYTKRIGRMFLGSVGFYTLLIVLVAGSAAAQEETQPVAGNIGTGISGLYNGPFPSETQKELVGPYQPLKM